MRKVFLVIVMSLPLVAATNWLINGDSVATDTVLSEMFIQGNFEGGDTIVDVTVYLDLDNDGVVDPEDPVLDYSVAIDGSWEDIDETVNGFFSTIGDMIPISGDFILTIEDAGGSDQVILHIMPLTSSYSIYGDIDPDTAGLIAMAIPKGYEDVYVGDVADANGNYTINIPDTYAGTYFNVMVMGAINILPDYLGHFSTDSILLSGNVLHNDSLIPTDYSMIYGVFVDENGLPYTKSVLSGTFGRFVDIFGDLYICNQGGSTDLGAGGMFLHTSPFGQVGNYWEARFETDADPYSMDPPRIDSIAFGSTPDTLADTITIYSCDAAITGTVFVDGTPADAIEMWAWNDTTGDAPWTGTYSDGHYRLLVSTYVDSYWVGVDTEDSVVEGDQYVPHGATGVNFHIITTGIEEISVEEIDFSISANPFVDKVVMEVYNLDEPSILNIYDITGKLVDVVSPESWINKSARYIWVGRDRRGNLLPVGIYFARIEGKRAITKKLILLR